MPASRDPGGRTNASAISLTAALAVVPISEGLVQAEPRDYRTYLLAKWSTAFLKSSVARY
jgi:hypothetical protein